MTFFAQIQHKYPYRKSAGTTDEGLAIDEGVDAPEFLTATRESLAVLGE